jgi:hypothetical protein
MKRILFLALLALNLNTKLAAQTISPYLFGQNYWLGNGDEGRVGYVDLLWPKVKESGVTCIRIGGNFYNNNFPERRRLSAMIDSIRGIGAEPVLQVPYNLTAIQAMELVEYFTSIGKNKVKYWSIGNEPLLEDKMTLDQVHKYILRIAPAMKKAAPSIKIFVFDECEMREAAYRELCGGKLDITGLKEGNNWLIDGFSFHKYPKGKEYVRDDVVFFGPELILKQATSLKQMMGAADKKHNRTGEAKLQWALTEVNVTWANSSREISGIGNPSFLGGQFIAEIFGIGMQNSAFSVNQWCINESDAVSSDFGYIGFPKEFFPRSSYYHIQIMAQNMKGSYVNTSGNQKYVKTIGSKSESNICVMVMNQDQNKNFDFEIVLDKNGKTTKELCINADASLDKRFSGTIENQTTMLFVFNSKGTAVKQITYGLKQNLAYQVPEVKELK